MFVILLFNGVIFINEHNLGSIQKDRFLTFRAKMIKEKKN